MSSYHESVAKPITIRCVTYRSHGEAARTLGVSKTTIRRAVENGWLKTVGLRPVQKKPVTIRGVTYPSYTEAGKALGITRNAIAIAVKQNRLNTVGLGRDHIHIPRNTEGRFTK